MVHGCKFQNCTIQCYEKDNELWIEIDWIDVKNKFPEKDKHVLVCFMDVTTPKICVASYDGLGWNHWPIGSFAGDGCIFNVTHWMPLPNLPKDF